MVPIPHPLRMGIKFSNPWTTLTIKFPPPWDGKGVKCPRYARWGGGGMLKLRFDRYITRKSYFIFSSRTLFTWRAASLSNQFCPPKFPGFSTRRLLFNAISVASVDSLKPSFTLKWYDLIFTRRRVIFQHAEVFCQRSFILCGSINLKCQLKKT